MKAQKLQARQGAYRIPNGVLQAPNPYCTFKDDRERRLVAPQLCDRCCNSLFDF